MRRENKICINQRSVNVEQYVTFKKNKYRHMIYIYKISFLVMIGLLMKSCAIIGLVESKKEYTGDFVVQLKPTTSVGYYNMSINVIQGLAAFEGGFFTSQTSAGKYLSINYLDKNGVSLYNHRFDIDSHGQDLSLEQISENELHLYTTVGKYNKDGASGIVRFIVTLPAKKNGIRGMSKIEIVEDAQYKLGLRNSTPSLNEEGTHFAIRSGNTIVVAKKEDVLKNNLSNAITFNIDKTQLMDGETSLWFQGIVMKDNLVYCFTGNSTIDSPKYIYIYNLKGEVQKKHTIDHLDFAKNIGDKYEPEGMTFINGELHYLIMTKAGTGGNLKYLFKLNQ